MYMGLLYIEACFNHFYQDVCYRNNSTLLTMYCFMFTDLMSHLVGFVDQNNGLIPFDGIPFMVLSMYTLGCMYGRDKHLRSMSSRYVQ